MSGGGGLAARVLAAIEWRVLVVLLLALVCAPSARVGATESAQADSRIHLVVLHTNDIHGQVLPRRATWLDREDPPLVGGLARAAAYVNRVRRETRESGASLLVVDAGDWFQGTPEGALDGGVGFARGLAAIGYDAMCVGNHELDRGLEHLQRLLRETSIPAVCANLFDRATERRITWAPPYRIVERDGLRIGIVGLLTPATPEITHRDARTLRFLDPAKSLAAVRAELDGKVDWVLPVTHEGIDEDRDLARAHPDLDLIVGGHSHTYLKEGIREGATRIVQAGSKASAVGRVDIWFDRHTKKVVDMRVGVVDLLDEPLEEDRNRDVEVISADLARKSAADMDTIVGELTAPLTRAKSGIGSSAAGNWIADALRKHTGADVGLMNRGGIRCDLVAGPLTRRDLFEISPFDNAVSVLALSGAELTEMLRRSVEGAAHSGLEVSGVVIEVAVRAKKRKLAAVEVGGAPLDPARTYRVAMNSFMADGGDAYLEGDGGAGRTDEPVLMREMLELVLKDSSRVVPDAADRYRVKK